MQKLMLALRSIKCAIALYLKKKKKLLKTALIKK